MSFNFDNVNELQEQAKKRLEAIHKTTIENLQAWVYPSTCGGTSAFGVCGQMLTTVTIVAFESEYGDGVLFLCGRGRYVKKFRPLMGWEDRK